MVIIYSITSLKGIKCYIGSTVQTLNNRKAQHKKKQNCTSKLLFDEYGFDNCIFTILEECTIEQRFERERHYIENTPDIVNIKIPTRTVKEYINANKERISEYQKNWSSMIIKCDICSKEIAKGCLLYHKKRHHITAS